MARQGSWHAAEGFLQSALKNFIALIGWSPQTNAKVLSEENLVAAFESFGGLPTFPGKFDLEKLRWLNGLD